MNETTKIEFRCRRITEIADLDELTAVLFPGNSNQQHAASCMLFSLKWSPNLMPSLTSLERQFGISRRTLQRTRAKLARLGLIEHVSSLNARYGGQSGWKLSGRFTGALRQLADRVEHWREAKAPDKQEKEKWMLEMGRTPASSK